MNDPLQAWMSIRVPDGTEGKANPKTLAIKSCPEEIITAKSLQSSKSEQPAWKGRLSDRLIEKRLLSWDTSIIKTESYTSGSCDVTFRGNIHGGSDLVLPKLRTVSLDRSAQSDKTEMNSWNRGRMLCAMRLIGVCMLIESAEREPSNKLENPRR